MKVVCAPDSYKGSMTASEAAAAMARACRRVWPDVETVMMPMADGGEGTVQALLHATGGRLVTATATGPLGSPVPASFGILGDGITAVIEMAAASGLPLVPADRRDPRLTTTRGTGDLIRAALDAGCRHLLIGVGGSATNDGGAGMAQALGAHLLDAHGRDLSPGGAALAHLHAIDVGGLDPRLAQCTVSVACDVDHPLTGERGASAVFGPQKGATPAVVAELDAALAHYANVIRRDLGVEVAHLPGAGAAGGLAAGLLAFLGATLRPGVEMVVAASRLREHLRGADLCLTGEGRIDGQTPHGKTPAGVAAAARDCGVPVLAMAGGLGTGYEEVYAVGIGGIGTLVPAPMALAEAMARGPELLEAATERALRVLELGRAMADRSTGG